MLAVEGVAEGGGGGVGEPPDLELRAVGRGEEMSVRAEGGPLRARVGEARERAALGGVPDAHAGRREGGEAWASEHQGGLLVLRAQIPGPLPRAGQGAVAGGVPELRGLALGTEGDQPAVLAQGRGHQAGRTVLEQYPAVRDRVQPYVVPLAHQKAAVGQVGEGEGERARVAGPAAGDRVPQPHAVAGGEGEDAGVGAGREHLAGREPPGAGTAGPAHVPGPPGTALDAEQRTAGVGEEPSRAVARGRVGEDRVLRLGEGAEQGPAGLGQRRHPPGGDAQQIAVRGSVVRIASATSATRRAAEGVGASWGSGCAGATQGCFFAVAGFGEFGDRRRRPHRRRSGHRHGGHRTQAAAALHRRPVRPAHQPATPHRSHQGLRPADPQIQQAGRLTPLRSERDHALAAIRSQAWLPP